MSYISLIIALIQMSNSGLVGNAWWYGFLTHVVGVEMFFFGLSWVIFGIALIIFIVLLIKGLFKHFLEGGCFALMFLGWLITLPLFEWITLSLAKGALANFDPVIGIVNQGPFILNSIFYLILGGG